MKSPATDPGSRPINSKVMSMRRAYRARSRKFMVQAGLKPTVGSISKMRRRPLINNSPGDWISPSAPLARQSLDRQPPSLRSRLQQPFGCLRDDGLFIDSVARYFKHSTLSRSRPRTGQSLFPDESLADVSTADECPNRAGPPAVTPADEHRAIVSRRS